MMMLPCYYVIITADATRFSRHTLRHAATLLMLLRHASYAVYYAIRC